ncbi:hypothetical protein D6850_01170 [Roseovarius spongiae]|uniref:Lipoprotein n=1 Tax=Roseovarius spongiae TaxID=2320272 RepID=A0A3A8AVC1_9RHOB|nr:hypothetical protein [Roseovarius spongiae]RKF16208.1 hypothetical protein D6850_01170 [Roseovarius spongiae]
MMKKRIAGLLGLSLAVAGCVETAEMASPARPNVPRVLSTVPENIKEMAAPSQDLTSVRVAPEDGCLWYLYAGPVETTWLPLRTRDGRPICTAKDAAA